FARIRLEAPIVATPGDRFVVRSYSPVLTIGGGTLLDVAPPRFKRKAPALVAHLRLLESGIPDGVIEEHVRHAGVSGVRRTALSGRAPVGPARLRALLGDLQRDGHVLAVDRDWYLHPDSYARLRDLALSALGEFHRAHPLRAGMSREELRGRVGAVDERLFAYLLSTLEAAGALHVERDKVHLASHAV